MFFRLILGMLTVGNMMSQVVRSKVKPSDHVSAVMYKQFKKVRNYIVQTICVKILFEFKLDGNYWYNYGTN